MTDSNQLFNEIVSELTKPGEIFETREIKDEKGNSFSEYVTFPDNLKGYFDFGLLHADKDFLVYESERYSFKETISKAAQVGNALIEEGIQKGDRVAIMYAKQSRVYFCIYGHCWNRRSLCSIKFLVGS